MIAAFRQRARAVVVAGEIGALSEGPTVLPGPPPVLSRATCRVVPSYGSLPEASMINQETNGVSQASENATNGIHAAYAHGAQRLSFRGLSFIYLREAAQPMHQLEPPECSETRRMCNSSATIILRRHEPTHR